MADLKTTLTTFAVQNLLPVALTAAAGVTTWIGVWLKNLIKAKVKNAQLAGILSRLDDHVTAAVLEGEQAVRPTLESVEKTGTLSPSDALQLKGDVLATIKAHLGAAGLTELKDVLGIQDVDSFLRTKLEAGVAKLGMQQAALVPPAAVVAAITPTGAA